MRMTMILIAALVAIVGVAGFGVGTDGGRVCVDRTGIASAHQVMGVPNLRWGELPASVRESINDDIRVAALACAQSQ